jgi:hypothetical protein
MSHPEIQAQRDERLTHITDHIVASRYEPFYILPNTVEALTGGRGGLQARLRISEVSARFKTGWEYELRHIASPESGLAVIQLYTPLIIWMVEKGYVREWSRFPADQWFGHKTEHFAVVDETNRFSKVIRPGAVINGRVEIFDEYSSGKGCHIQLYYSLADGAHSGIRHLALLFDAL